MRPMGMVWARRPQKRIFRACCAARLPMSTEYHRIAARKAVYPTQKLHVSYTFPTQKLCRKRPQMKPRAQFLHSICTVSARAQILHSFAQFLPKSVQKLCIYHSAQHLHSFAHFLPKSVQNLCKIQAAQFLHSFAHFLPKSVQNLCKCHSYMILSLIYVNETEYHRAVHWRKGNARAARAGRGRGRHVRHVLLLLLVGEVGETPEFGGGRGNFGGARQFPSCSAGMNLFWMLGCVETYISLAQHEI